MRWRGSGNRCRVCCRLGSLPLQQGPLDSQVPLAENPLGTLVATCGTGDLHEASVRLAHGTSRKTRSIRWFIGWSRSGMASGRGSSKLGSSGSADRSGRPGTALGSTRTAPVREGLGQMAATPRGVYYCYAPPMARLGGAQHLWFRPSGAL